MPMTTKHEPTGYILALLAAIFYASAGVIGRMIFQYEPEPLTVTTVRAIIAIALMFLGFLIFHRDLLKIRKRDIPIFAVHGFVGITCSSLCFFYALKYTTVATTVILLYTYPAIVVIFSAIFLRESLTRQKLVALLLTFFGALLVIQCYNLQSLKLNLTGILFGLGTSLCVATYTLLGKKAIVNYDSWTIVFYALVFGTLFLILFRTPQILIQVRYPWQGWVWMLLHALLPTIAASACYMASLHHLEAGKVSIIGLSEIVIAPLFAIIFLHEGVELLQIVGAGLVIWGIILVWKKKDREQETVSSSESP